MICTSANNMRTALQAAQEYLSNDPNAPVELICQIYNGLAPIDWEDDPKKNFKIWLLCGGKYQVESIADAEKMFCIGFQFAKEKFDIEHFVS
ncbi:TPA: hypothetical protein N2826_004005 [Vibrio parahaemolyticus]|nr:hypothetical protein [Vibrio parahaemolyticus]MBE4286472.1 hypothetical protein [Vibrio parahaemolyticus]HCG8859899.1 hypothetical protein [Vibrio parahaemolyticus]HCH1183490.1 hypothetical protein [Vibrio parahaemolyticus]HCH1183528.1 hypothetical protein [Vibrio parahaemolyticus]